MKKRILSLLLALVLCMALLPTAAFASGGSGTQSDPCIISTGEGLDLTTLPTETTYYKDENGGTAVFTPASGSNTATLALDNMTIATSSGDGIAAYTDLQITVSGSCTISSLGAGIIVGFNSNAGRWSNMTVTVEKGASLKISATGYGIRTQNTLSLYNSGTIEIEGPGAFESIATNKLNIVSTGKIIAHRANYSTIGAKTATVDLSNGGELYLFSSRHCVFSKNCEAFSVYSGTVYIAGSEAFHNGFASSSFTLTGGATAVLAVSENRWIDGDATAQLPEGAVLITNASEEVRNAIASGTPVCKVSFNANGGEGTMEDVIETGSSYTLPECTFTAPTGKVFAGWAVGSANGTVKQAGDKITVTGATTLYAQWKKPTAEITWPTASEIVYGQALSQSHLIGGSTELGTFAWADASVVPEAGTHSAEVTFTPNETALNTYDWTNATMTQSVSVMVAKANPAVSVSAGEITGTGDIRTMTLTATVSGVSGTATPTGNVTFKAGTETIGTAALENGTASFTWDSAAKDTTYAITAEYEGNPDYNSATSHVLHEDTSRKNQTIEIAEIGSKTYGDAPFTLSLSNAGSGTGDVTWESSDESILRIEGDTATILKPGEVTITATKAADHDYNEAEAAIDIEIDEQPTAGIAVIPSGGASASDDGTAEEDETEPTEETVESECPAEKFTDVDLTQYYHEALDWAIENGIVSGTSATTFGPNESCTRAQAVTFLWRAAGCPEPESTENPFTDVSEDAYYYKAVLWAVENGITVGTSATTFSPNKTCIRAQIVTFLYRAAGEPETSTIGSFTDVASSAYYAAAVEWAAQNEIAAGTGNGKFSPASDCVRAQIVTFLWRANA